MNLEPQANPALPRLAWCVRMERGAGIAMLEHGPWVETGPDWFFEGAWNGPFNRDSLMQASAVLGSGAVATGKELVFIPGTHTMERLHLCREGDTLYVSNSFVYLLTVLGDSLDTRHLGYEAEFLSVLRGYHRMHPSVRTRQGRHIQLHYYLRLAADAQLRTRTFAPPPVESFDTYDGYVRHLQDTSAAITKNAAAPGRSVTYSPLATVSTGYDSPACAIVARSCGCTEAVTFVSARQEHVGINVVTDSNDAGSRIAEKLGLSVKEFDRTRYMERRDAPEAEFLATGSGGDDVVMSVLESHLPRKVFFTGFRGDTIWGLDEQDPDDSARFKTKDPSGASMGEFRLRVGFVHVPLPAICMPAHADILRISKLPEMAPWRLGNGYDRPIPRRIVESAGVAREDFGQEKKAITQPFWVTRDNGAMFGEHSRQALLTYSRALEARNRRRISHQMRRAWALLWVRLVWRADRLADKLPFRVPVRYPMSLRNLISDTGYRFHWSVEQIRDRYEPSLMGARAREATLGDHGAQPPVRN